MTITEQTLTEYRERFKAVIPNWLVYTESKRWYGKYHFRLELDRVQDWDLRNKMRREAQYLDPDCRIRQESFLRVFTNSTDMLDAFLNNPEFRKNVRGFTTSNEQYITAMNNLDNIAVDVKLVSEKKYNPDIPYQVDFETYWGWQTVGLSNRKTQRENLLGLYKFVTDNKDDLFMPYELNRWCVRTGTGLETGYYYGAVRVFCRSGDNIPLLYMLFQDGIKKVYKLEKRVKA